jgi:glycosyltransferase involved in cell wall biosynthesis
MRLLYFHQHFTTPRGASGTRSYEFARRLIARGHSVTMVCGSYGTGNTGLSGEFRKGRRSGTVDGIRVIELHLPYSNADSFLKRSFTFLKFAARSVGIALSESYDLLFATSTPLTAAIPGIVARPIRQKPFVFEVRDLWPELPREMGVITNPVILWGLGVLERMGYRKADHVIGLAPGIVEGIKARSPAGRATSLIPNGCDLTVFVPAEAAERNIPGVEADDFVAVFTGAHGLANGLHAVLDAAAELRKRNQEHVKLVFIGDGMQKQALRERAAREELSNCVFLDPVPKGELAKLMQSADLGLMILANVEAFYFGTSPNKFFDYIAGGMPVLCNYPGWVSEMLVEWGAGVAVPPDDPAAFADALTDLAAKPESLAQMGRRARELAERQFDREKLADQFVDVMESVVADEKSL